MEDIDFKIPMTRDKLVELGQYLPPTGQLHLQYLHSNVSSFLYSAPLCLS